MNSRLVWAIGQTRAQNKYNKKNLLWHHTKTESLVQPDLTVKWSWKTVLESFHSMLFYGLHLRLLYVQTHWSSCTIPTGSMILWLLLGSSHGRWGKFVSHPSPMLPESHSSPRSPPPPPYSPQSVFSLFCYYCFSKTHWVQIMFPKYSWTWNLPWNMMYQSLKKIDSTSLHSNQMPITSQPG